MKAVGYGVTRNGEPAGMWPVPLDYAQTSLTRYRANDKTEASTWAIVPIFMGEPLVAATEVSDG